jgi:hypothetical protein
MSEATFLHELLDKCQILHIWTLYFAFVNPLALLFSDVLCSSMFSVFCRLVKENYG